MDNRLRELKRAEAVLLLVLERMERPYTRAELMEASGISSLTTFYAARNRLLQMGLWSVVNGLDGTYVPSVGGGGVVVGRGETPSGVSIDDSSYILYYRNSPPDYQPTDKDYQSTGNSSSIPTPQMNGHYQSTGNHYQSTGNEYQSTGKDYQPTGNPLGPQKQIGEIVRAWKQLFPQAQFDFRGANKLLTLAGSLDRLLEVMQEVADNPKAHNPYGLVKWKLENDVPPPAPPSIRPAVGAEAYVPGQDLPPPSPEWLMRQEQIKNMVLPPEDLSW